MVPVTVVITDSQEVLSCGYCFQIGVLQWFAKLWEIDSKDYWGYITNCGTEGNLHGILVGRENHPDGESSKCCHAI